MRKCRVCFSKKLTKISSLGDQPLANRLISKPNKRVDLYPLELYQCNVCTLVQLGKVVDKKKLYDEYYYIPSVSKTHLDHFEKLAYHLNSVVACLNKKDLVVDIGSSDGSLLKIFREFGMKTIGIEPAKNIKSSEKTIREYFSPKVARSVVKKYGKAKLVTATNVFAHIDNLKEFLKGLEILLDDNGIFFAQFPDYRNLLRDNQFDTIYHEHLSYFTYEPLYYLFSQGNLELFNIETYDIHGGSMRIYVRKRPKLFNNFVKNVKKIKKDLRSYLIKEKKRGAKIVGFGAAAKGTVLLNYCKIDSKILDYVADGTPYKQGKYIPGVNVLVVPESKLKEDKPDIVLILAWNFKEEIIKKLSYLNCIFVVPIPQVEII